MKINKAFTLIEVLISLGISAFIIFAMMRVNLNVQSFIDKTYISSKTNKKVYLFLNQIEKDLSAAIIVDLEKKITDKKIEKNNPELDKQKTQEDMNYFKSTIFDGENFKKFGKKFELLKSLSFISTNAYEVYDEKNIRLVRVGYFLEKNKNLSKKDTIVYNLFRKETFDLKNVDFKVSQEMSDKNSQVRSFLIADNIKEFSIEYQLLIKDNEYKDKTTDKNKELNLFVWGQKDETKNILPNYVFIMVSFWDNRFIGENVFSKIVPILACEYANENKKTNKNKDENQIEQNKVNKSENKV